MDNISDLISRLKRSKLTLRDLEKFYEGDLEILLKKGYHPKRLMGYYDGGDEIRVYLPEHKTKRDVTLTILHEFIHVKDENAYALRLSKKEEDEIEDEINRKAERILRRRPGIEDFIGELWGLDY